MTTFPCANIVKNLEEKLISQSPKLIKYLFKGDLKSFEESLHELVLEFYDKLAKAIICYVLNSQKYKLLMIKFGGRYGFGKYRKRETELQLRTGSYIRIPSYYSYIDKMTQKGNPKFDTPWKEPKIFVIQTLNEHGELEREENLPFYGATMEGGDKALEELVDALETLQISKAKEIQFIADGAQFFWNNIKEILLEVGVSMKKVTFTLDYFHAIKHLYELVRSIPNKTEKESNQLIKDLKDHLFNGTIYSLIQTVRTQLNGYTDENIEREINYFQKHYDHMQYKKFKRKKWLLGSGLVESAIRRIINLRFKSTSSFWKVEYLNQLIRLRAAFLAGRWNLFIDFLANRLIPKLGTK